jgi:hypothetical protein
MRYKAYRQSYGRKIDVIGPGINITRLYYRENDEFITNDKRVVRGFEGSKEMIDSVYYAPKLEFLIIPESNPFFNLDVFLTFYDEIPLTKTKIRLHGLYYEVERAVSIYFNRVMIAGVLLNK